MHGAAGRRISVEVVDSEPTRRLNTENYRLYLGRVVSSVTFQRADQLRRLLQWLGERSLVEPPVAPSEREIAEIVLRRTNFEPQADSLVRKEMSRLRDKLIRYYLREGSQDEIRIRSNAGYLLQFERCDASRGIIDREPCWLVLPFRTSPDVSEGGIRLFEELVFRLSERQGLQLVSPTTALGYGGRSGDIRKFAVECGADFVIEGSLRNEKGDPQANQNEGVEATVWFIDGQSGLVRRSARICGSETEKIAWDMAAWLFEEDE
jgi:TolB-like protein